jgi:MFS family permease
VTGIGMLVGAIGGGFLAQATSLAAPYVVRMGLLVVTIGIAVFMMRDLGFTPMRGKGPVDEARTILAQSVDSGLRNPPVRWVMLAAPFTVGIGFYAFYAMQPYLLELYGDETAYGIAGIAAALYAGAQIIGGVAVPYARKLFAYRTHYLATAIVISAIALISIGLVSRFWFVIALFVVWSTVSAASLPLRQAFINGVIPSDRRATVLSFDSLMGSLGGVVIQPTLGRVADVSGYAASYVVAGVIQAVALPFMLLARREQAPSDPLVDAADGA